MSTENQMKPPDLRTGTSTGAPLPLRTKNQTKASAMADGFATRARWKALITEAKATWEKLYPEELAKVDGNFHKLAGLVQLRYHISREESDRQVRDFFDKHYSVA